MSQPLNTRLVADIGGTNSRLALYDPHSDELRALRTYLNREYGQFEDIVEDWLNALNEPRPAQCCLAVAAPPFDTRVTMLNIDWSFSLPDLASRFEFDELCGINDFEANAYALPHISESHLHVLSPGQTAKNSKLATVGPGTGLGGATLSWIGGLATASASEPGHMGLTPASELELELFRYLLPRSGEVYAELLVSGPGLQRLYQALGDIAGRTTIPLSSEDISRKAQQQECEHCVLTLNTFCALLGSICGDYALANGAYGGLYLAGGFLPGMIDFLEQSTFVQRFVEKGKMRAHLEQVPLYVITGKTTGLLGAAHAPTAAT
ncbi:Glucokinase [Halioglobus japonicus]|nr:Glucokinase [Halioglobus japonicus]